MKTGNSRLLPVLFTVSYFGMALFIPTYSPLVQALYFSSFTFDQSLVGRSILIGIATLASLLLWTFCHFWIERFSRSHTELLPVGFLLPVLLYATPAFIVHHQQLKSMAMDARINKEARLIDMQDEELLTAAGNPIGVRLRYRVHYPEGAAALIPHIPPASLSEVPFPYPESFWVRNAESHALNAADYETTLEMVPGFMPSTIRFLENSKYPGTGGKDPCFNWSYDPAKRKDVLNPGQRTFHIKLYVPKYSSETQRSYDLHRFYEGALKEGAKECSS